MSDDKEKLSSAEIEELSAKVLKIAQKDADTYPAMYLVDWPGGPVYACNDHAAKLITIGRTLGHSIGLQGCTPGHACSNCVNEAKKKEEKSDAAD